jgi:hypothetical protein
MVAGAPLGQAREQLVEHFGLLPAAQTFIDNRAPQMGSVGIVHPGQSDPVSRYHIWQSSDDRVTVLHGGLLVIRAARDPGPPVLTEDGQDGWDSTGLAEVIHDDLRRQTHNVTASFSTS